MTSWNQLAGKYNTSPTSSSAVTWRPSMSLGIGLLLETVLTGQKLSGNDAFASLFRAVSESEASMSLMASFSIWSSSSSSSWLLSFPGWAVTALTECLTFSSLKRQSCTAANGAPSSRKPGTYEISPLAWSCAWRTPAGARRSRHRGLNNRNSLRPRSRI